MCGILACISVNNINQNSLQKGLDNMISRGPDNIGIWKTENIFLGHRRLSIIDVEARSSQPMLSNCGNYVIIFNGEIYNYLELRKILISKGIELKTNSDTEVILEFFKLEKEQILSKLKGMFAFLIWDIGERKAFIARDPYGIKPLYIGQNDSDLIIASQVKAILATGLISNEINPVAQAKYWILGSVPEPQTWYKKINAIESGSYIWIKNNEIIEKKIWCNINKFWLNAEFYNQNNKKYILIKHIRKYMLESLSRHLVADVPIGLFLSGGIDSGVLAALMSELGIKNIVGVTIAYKEFENSHHDESIMASKIASFYGIKHHIRYVTKDEFNEDLPKILLAMDQPSIDGVNTWFASKAVSELGLKVVLSGVGGDELFMGYETFKTLPFLVKFWRLIKKVPFSNYIIKPFFLLLSKFYNNNRWLDANDLLNSIAGAWLLKRSINSIKSISNFTNIKSYQLDIDKYNFSTLVNSMTGERPKDMNLQLAQIESMTYLRNQLLRDSDWASMAHSVELRTPFVDVTLLENMTPILKQFKKYPNKLLLANTPSKPLPKEITHKQKTGFSIPIKEWLSTNELYSQKWQTVVSDNYML